MDTAPDLPSNMPAVTLDRDANISFLTAGTHHLFDDPSGVWFILEGTVDLFAVQRRNGRQTGTREHLGTLPTGALIWGIEQSASEDGIHLVALMVGDVRLARLDIGAIANLNEGLVAALDQWIAVLLRGMTRHVTPRSVPKLSIAAGEDMTLAEHDRVISRKGVVWVQLLDGNARYLDIRVMASPEGTAMLPLSQQAWIQESGVRTLRGHGTDFVVQAGNLPARMDAFHGWVFHLLAYGFRNIASKEVGRLSRRNAQVTDEVKNTLADFAGMLNVRAVARSRMATEHALFECCSIVGRMLNLTITVPAYALRRRNEEKPLSIDDIAASSQVRVRQVILRDRWWLEDSGPMVGFVGPDSRPVALLPQSSRTYVMRDPLTRVEQPVTSESAATLLAEAYVFYPSLPNRTLGAWDLLAFVVQFCRADLAVMALAGALGGLISILVPVVTGYVFDSVVPGHQSAQLMQAGLALVVAAITAAAFHFANDVAQLRVEGRIAGLLQTAFMDRLLRLPTSFFSAYSTGDLAQRTLVIEIIRRSLTGIVLGSLVSGVFSIFSYALLFYYSPAVAGIASLLVLILGMATVLAGYRQMDAIMRGEERAGVLNSRVLEIVTGIVKLRLAGAEDRAFVTWGRDFTTLTSLHLKARRIAIGFAVFWSGYEILSLAAIFAGIALLAGHGMTTGSFLAFVAAFTALLSAAHAMAHSTLAIFAVRPLYTRATPILATVPESNLNKTEPGVLSGEFEVNSVVFRYVANAPRVLNGLSLKVKAGEFVALVGPSGCGKSTLMRLLLGLERAESGGIYFDGRDLRGLNLQSVRRQIGVVLQNSRLMPGSIFENIRGATGANFEECEQAAVMTGLGDDIAAMPMGLHTVLTEGTAALSGGQIQRILLARAIVGKPRILLLDEATSALDNRTQAMVTDHLDRLTITRIVIAHRLSTIVKADRIYVLKEGRIIETGDYHQLMHQGGLFAEFARRQTL